MTAVFSAALTMAGLASGVHDLGVSVSEIKEAELRPILVKLAEMHELDPADIAEFVANIKIGKFREVLPDDLARRSWARQNESAVCAIAASARGTQKCD